MLQAPVSDREQPMTEPNYETNIQHARDLVTANKGSEMMPRDVFWAPITAQRFLDLQDVGGNDDYFSSDFTNEQLADRLGHVSERSTSKRKVLVAYSGSDEYVPKHVDTKLLTKRLVHAMNSKCSSSSDDGGDDAVGVAESLYLDTANHNLSEGKGDAEKFVAKVTELLKEAGSESN